MLMIAAIVAALSVSAVTGLTTPRSEAWNNILRRDDATLLTDITQISNYWGQIRP